MENANLQKIFFEKASGTLEAFSYVYSHWQINEKAVENAFVDSANMILLLNRYQERKTLRFVDVLRAKKQPGYIRIPTIPRTPWKIYVDRRDRRSMSTTLMHASNRHHDRLLDYGNKVLETPYPELLEDYVLSHLPKYIEDLWYEDRFCVNIVSFNDMKRRLSKAARRSGVECTKTQLMLTNGLYCPHDGGIFIREGTFPARYWFGDHQWQNIEDVCGHEFGHYVDAVFDNPFEWDELFHEVYCVERAKLDSYSAADPREYFATTCWICSRYPRIAKKYIAKTAVYFSDLFAEGELEN